MQLPLIKKLRFLLTALLLLSQYGYSQITQPAGVETYTIRKEAVTNPSTIVTLTNAEKTRSISYIDGFGRPLQSIVAAGSPNGKDIVSFNKYDQYGRQPKQYLPYEATTGTGAYVNLGDLPSNQSDFYDPAYAASRKIAIDNGPYYAEMSFDNSPLQRVLKTGGIGDGFQLNQHYKTISYSTSLASDNIHIWVSGSSNATGTGTYGDHALTVTELEDEAGAISKVYKDKFGRLILKRQKKDNTTNYDTYYVYDIAGNITFIIPPRAITQMVTFGYDTYYTPDLVYQFWYDSKNRIVQKKVPGAKEVYMVYDPLNRVVLTQDGNMRHGGAKKWAYIKYDNANRVIIQGIYTHSGTEQTQAEMQAYVDSGLTDPSSESENPPYYEQKQATASGYSNQCFPTTGTEERQYAYYDNYDFNYDGNADYSKEDQGLTGEATATDLTYGLLTGTKKKILGSGTPGTWLVEMSFYDKYYHVIQVRSNNQIKTDVTDHTTNVVNFVGQATEAKQVKTIGDPNGITNTLEIEVSTRYEYDDMGRLTKVKQTNPGESELTVAKYEYNALGQLVDKKLHSTNGTNYLQSVDMRYNIRGQLLSINNSARNINANNNDDDNDLFGMEILYEKVETGLNSTTANYSGMISAVKWSAAGPATNTAERSFKYSYDKLYRLTAATYQEKTGSNWTQNQGDFDESFTYDENGNILTTDRWARFLSSSSRTKIDQLSYSYMSSDNSNQLKDITDAITTNATGYGYRDFMSSGSTTPYSYDDNGNLTQDLKKGTTITYNELNKPVTITRSTFWGNQVIEYIYDASGNRISKHVTGGTVITTFKEIEYIGGYVIENGILSYYSMAEGRVRNESGSSSLSMKMEYFITDQQGNTRISFEDDGTNTNHAQLTQENSYYAFGMQMAGSYTPTNPNKKLYNAGSEWQDDEEGLADYYSTFYREYDPIIGRFNGVDPMAEATDNMTTYAYANNNPIMMNDPMGDFAAGGPSGSIFKTGPDGERHIGWAAELMWNQLGFSDMEDNDSGGGGGGGFSNGGSGVYTNWAGQTSTEYLAAMQSGYKVKYDKDTREYGYKVYSFENGLGSAANGNTLRGVESSAKWVPFPNFATLLSNYPLPYWKRPDRTPNKDKGYTQVDDANGNSFDHFNQCAIRMSICLIKSGVNISGAKNITNPGGTTYGNGNVLGAINLGNHLKINILGKPTFTKDGTKDDVFSLISGKTGIIYFQNIVEDGTRAWGNAHIDLWDKDHYQGTDEMGRPYPFDQMLDAKIIWFWEIK